MIDNSIIKNRLLSVNARFLLIAMLSVSDKWEFKISGLCTITGMGRDAVSRALNELEKAGHIRRDQKRYADGQFGENVFDVFEEPLTEYPLTDKPLTDKPLTDKPLTYK